MGLKSPFLFALVICTFKYTESVYNLFISCTNGTSHILHAFIWALGNHLGIYYCTYVWVESVLSKRFGHFKQFLWQGWVYLCKIMDFNKFFNKINAICVLVLFISCPLLFMRMRVSVNIRTFRNLDSCSCSIKDIVF